EHRLALVPAWRPQLELHADRTAFVAGTEAGLAGEEAGVTGRIDDDAGGELVRPPERVPRTDAGDLAVVLEQSLDMCLQPDLGTRVDRLRTEPLIGASDVEH